MNTIFWGTPDFAIPSMEKIFSSHHKIVAVVTTPDKEKGRGLKPSFSPVKEFAVQNNIPVLQPVSFKDEQFIQNLKHINADVYVIVAFKILPEEIFTIPQFGSFNLHGSLLPKYRGAAPIQWAIINGEKETGVTTFKLAEKVDTGNIYLTKQIPISDSDNFGSLHDKLSVLGSEAVIETLNLIESGNYELMQQDNTLASPAPKITKELAELSWERTAKQMRDLIRGLSPYPGAVFTHKDITYKVFDTEVNNSMTLSQGEFYFTKDSLWIGCAEGTLKILEIQREGKKRMKIEEFLRGNKFN